jgi:hypothetical protein
MPEIVPSDLVHVARRLQPLCIPFVFVGGGVLPLLIDDTGAARPRGTRDVDVVVQVVTHAEYTRLEQELRNHGFRHDTSEGAPICRWIADHLLIDIMPVVDERLGMNTRWFEQALAAAEIRTVDGLELRIVSPACFLALKLEAFADRGQGDFLGSRDMEDFIAVVDGRTSIIDDYAKAPSPIRSFLSQGVKELLADRDFLESLAGHLGPDPASQARLSLLRARLKSMAG